MKIKILKFISILIVLLVPFAAFALAVESIPNMYANTYTAALADKCERLNDTDGKKIVFVGGSSLPFGLRSDIAEQCLDGYAVVNFGLYATLGTKFMMDLSKSNIKSGDIVVLAPELNAQTYSLYFNPDAVLEACNGLPSAVGRIPASDNIKCIYNYFKFAFEKIELYKENGKNGIDPIGIYRKDSFNEYGDISVERENNVMNNGCDINMLVETTEELLDAEFIDYVNDYIKWVRKRGAEIYFSYSPVNVKAIRSSKTMRAEFEKALEKSLDCELLYGIEDCLIDERYFYDTNFHLNSAGAVYYTDLLVSAVKKKLGITTENGIDVPPAPPLPQDVVVEPPVGEKVPFDEYTGEPNNDYAECFEYRLYGSSYAVVGVKDEYKDMEEVILPSTYNGKNITTLAENALRGCINLKRIHIGLTYKTLENSAFDGCIALERIYLYQLDGENISAPRSGLLDGCNPSVRIYVPEGSNYFTGYTWSSYQERFEYFSKETS